jgi:hypothetical protein
VWKVFVAALCLYADLGTNTGLPRGIRVDWPRVPARRFLDGRVLIRRIPG